MRYVLEICYDGGDFSGFQRQKNLVTIQGEIEKVLSKKLQEDISIVASGRTDTGVHAIGQIAHFDTDKKLDVDKFAYSINSMLPKSIAIKSCKLVDESFHARYSAKRKTYEYKIYLSKTHEPLKRKYYHICFYDLDINKMIEGSKYLLGEHDFKAFMAAQKIEKNTVRTIYSIEIFQRDDNKEIDIEITGNGFLHNMVRSIVGTLVDVGRGRFAPQYVKEILDSKEHQKAGKTLSGCGLYLKSVQYI